MDGKISITNWKPLASGSLKGAFDAELPSGMILLGCTLFEKDGRHWIKVPEKQFQVGGVTKYRPAINFVDRTTAVEFQDAVLRALRAAHPEVLSCRGLHILDRREAEDSSESGF